MDSKFFLNLAEQVIEGSSLSKETLQILANLPEQKVFHLFAGSNLIREYYFERKIHLCSISNGKSGKCSEDCTFCSQSAISKADIPIYPLRSQDRLRQEASEIIKTPIHRYSIVTSGKKLSRKEVETVAEAIAGLDQSRAKYCASLGSLGREELELLKKSGVSRYHHNLETAESHFHNICTTHSYQDRIKTIKIAQAVGFSICCGGLFGIGETDEQVLELALAIKELNVDCIPLNFLVSIAGTKLECAPFLSPMRCLKIIAIFRYVLPDKDILIAGGRESKIKELHPLIFYAGANAIMTGNYLTTIGRSLEQDLSLLERLQLSLL